MSLVTDQIAKSVLDGMIGINETRRNIDASIDESRCIVLSQQMIEQSKKDFNYNVGRTSDGKLLRLDEKEIYFKVTVNINANIKGQYRNSYIFKSSERAGNGFPSIIAYVNGLKVPDSEVLFYATQTNIDVFFPLKYVDTSTVEVLIERKNYSQRPYIRYYEKNTSGQTFYIPVDKEKLSRSIVKDRTAMIFVNKKLFMGNRSVRVENENTVVVSLYQELTNGELEIIIDQGINYFLIQPSMKAGNIGVFEIPETYIDSIHGPVSKFSCYFFADGKRLLNDHVKQEGRLHFSYDFGKSSTAILATYVTDIGYITDTNQIFYGSDYYLYNMTGTSPISEVFKGNPSNTIFDNHIDFYDVLSDGRDKYDREHIKDVLDEFYSLPSPEEKTKYLLSSKPYPMRNFLENYGKVIYTYTVEYNGHDPYVFIGLPETYEVDTDHVYDICINNYHIPSDEISVIKKNITDVFRVPSILFKEGINVVEITVLENNVVEYVRVAKDDIPTEEGGIVYKIPVFKKFISISDIYVLEKSSGNDSLTYPNSYGNGYTCFNDAYLSYDEEKREIIVKFDRYPDNDIIIYNSNFTTSYKYQKPINSTALDVMIPLYAGSDIDPIPYIPKGKLTIYAGNDKLIQGIDYFIKHPVNDSKAGGSFIIVKRAMLPGTNFDIYFSNIITKKVIEKEGYFINNPYGLFYLGNLEFPFSLKYLDVYINNRRCTEADIDILSDKLIRIHSLPVPMFDLSVESTFTVEDEYLQPYIDLYEEDDFEKYIASLFRGVFHNRPYNPDEINPNYNAIYESFIDSVDSVNKRPNPVAREAEWIPSENDNPSVIGIYNTGDAMGGNDIYASIVVGDIYVVAGEGGRVASCNTKTTAWNNYDSGGRYSCDGTHFEGNITDIAFYRGLLVFSTDKGEIAYYDVVNDVWGFPNNGEGSLDLNKLPYEYFPGAIYKMVIVEDCLVIMGENGNVTSYNFNGDTWYSYTDYSRKNAFTAQGIMDDIYDAYVHAYYQLGKYNIVLITFGKNGEIASGFYETNHWTKSNGERLHPLNSGPQYFHDGNSRGFKDIYKVNRYLDYLVLYGKEGLVTLYSLDTLTALSVGDSRNISNDGKHNGYRDTRAAINYSGSILVTGASEGKVSSYFGENERWHEFNGETGIANDGNVMDGRSIYTISYTFVGTNYIIFAGEDGKVGSYNVDVHELSFRFNPYKTAFLLWYTTPGSAYIKTSWKLPEKVMDLFSLYKETGDLNYDITLAAGDQDIIADIDMDDRGKYPYTHAARRQYIIDFILSLDEGKYTADEVWEKYMNSYHKYILYPWDVVPLAGGDELDGEDDIDITTKGVLNPAS